MPNGDKKGPLGFGARSGRGKGFCSGATQPGYFDDLAGMGRGLGRGARGRLGRAFGSGSGCGLRRGDNFGEASLSEMDIIVDSKQSSNDKKELLQMEAKKIESKLAQINSKIKKIESNSND